MVAQQTLDLRVLVRIQAGQFIALRTGDAQSKGRIPAELMEDEDLAAKLPLIFRALRGKRLTNKRLNHLVKKVRAG